VGKPVALQRDEYFFLFSKNGVEKYDGNSMGWIFQFEEKLWALSDSNEGSKHPCKSFQWFSQQNQAYIVQATSPARDRWHRWSTECSARSVIMKCFTEKEAKALRSVIIAGILFIHFNFTLTA